LWLIKHWFSASTFVVKIATFAELPTACEVCFNPIEIRLEFSNQELIGFEANDVQQ
jgi:hypothetical protein